MLNSSNIFDVETLSEKKIPQHTQISTEEICLQNSVYTVAKII
jgi:hypothetical protein